MNAPPDHPIDALWRPRAMLWAVLAGEGLALALAIAPGAAIDRGIYFGLASLWIQWVLVLTLGSVYLLRHPLRRLRPLAVAAIGLLIAVAWCWAIAGVAGPLAMPGLGGQWIALAWQSSLIAVVIGGLGLAALDNYWHGQRHAVRAKQAELEALQARIHPHFLFNTLNTGAALVHARPGEAERLLLDLADLFRAALAEPREIPLADELALARRYLEIEALRFGPRLSVQWRMPEALPDVSVPALSIQPLVENAIRHGVEPAAEGGRVDVEVAVAEGIVRIVVRNDLPGPVATPVPGHRVGLASARERIGALSGGRGVLETRVEAGRYVATITLPKS
jgi:two-component system sensor histidine kinase AlgZ